MILKHFITGFEHWTTQNRLVDHGKLKPKQTRGEAMKNLVEPHLAFFFMAASFGPSEEISVLKSSLESAFNLDMKVVGAHLENASGKKHRGHSLSYCLSFVSRFLESPHAQDGVLNRILQANEVVAGSELSDGNVLGLTARFPNSFAWFGFPRAEGTFR